MDETGPKGEMWESNNLIENHIVRIQIRLRGLDRKYICVILDIHVYEYIQLYNFFNLFYFNSYRTGCGLKCSTIIELFNSKWYEDVAKIVWLVKQLSEFDGPISSFNYYKLHGCILYRYFGIYHYIWIWFWFCSHYNIIRYSRLILF